MAVNANNTRIPDSETSPNDAGLLPCPFCGGRAEMWPAIEGTRRRAWISCMGKCVTLITHQFSTNEAACKMWNTRAKVAS